MGRKCFVRYCRTGYASTKGEGKVSLFRVSEDRLEEWSKHMPTRNRPLTTKDFICEKHFEPNLVIRKIENEIYTILLLTPKLAPNAVPTIFDIEDPLKCHRHRSITVEARIFSELKTKIDSLALPTPEWNIYISQNAIAIYKVANVHNNVFMQKKIVSTEEALTCYIAERKCDMKNIFAKSVLSMELLQEFLVLFENVQLCPGGVSLFTAPANFKSSVYVKDEFFESWRHSKCPLIVAQGESECSWCRKVENALRVFLLKAKSDDKSAIAIRKPQIVRRKQVPA